MTHILLTGAGFSFNWGGLLANDMFCRLLGSTLLDDTLRQMLWRNPANSGGFEDVLAALQNAIDADGKRRYDILTSELVGLNGMDLAFTQREFEFRNPPDTRYSVASFLPRFDTIFSLNQDTLLEQKYVPFVSNGRWGGAHLPGLKHLAGFLRQPAPCMIGLRSWNRTPVTFGFPLACSPILSCMAPVTRSKDRPAVASSSWAAKRPSTSDGFRSSPGITRNFAIS